MANLLNFDSDDPTHSQDSILPTQKSSSLDSKVQLNLHTQAHQIVQKQQHLDLLSSLIFSNERYLLKIKSLEQQISQAEKTLKFLDYKITQKQEQEIKQLDNLNQLEEDLRAGVENLETEKLSQHEVMTGEIYQNSRFLKLRQEKLSKDLLHIFPIDSNGSIFVDVKCPMKAELTIHQAFATGDFGLRPPSINSSSTSLNSSPAKSGQRFSLFSRNASNVSKKSLDDLALRV